MEIELCVVNETEPEYYSKIRLVYDEHSNKIYIMNRECSFFVDSNEYDTFNRTVRLMARDSKAYKIILNDIDYHIQRIGNSSDAFMMTFVHNNEAQILKLNYLPFVGDRNIDFTISGFLELQNSEELERIKSAIDVIDVPGYTASFE